MKLGYFAWCRSNNVIVPTVIRSCTNTWTAMSWRQITSSMGLLMGVEPNSGGSADFAAPLARLHVMITITANGWKWGIVVSLTLLSSHRGHCHQAQHVHNCRTRNSTEQSWLSSLLFSRQAPELRCCLLEGRAKVLLLRAFWTRVIT